jgi:8-oxo-dGTP diphosphatase
MEYMQTTYIDKLAYIHMKDGKLLMTLSRGKEAWYIPGGKREVGESDYEALTREVKEELDVDLIQETIEYYGTFEAQADGKPLGTIVRMTCYQGEYAGNLTAASEIEKIDFFNYAQKELSSFVDHLIFDDLYAHMLLI